MLTVTRLARACGLSRSTVLYYESIGLLKPAGRSGGNYRCYGAEAEARLKRICAYRNAGLRLADIRALLDGAPGGAAGVLERRVAEIDAEIETLRGHQRAILTLLRNKKAFGRTTVITKDKWVSIMRSCGFTQEQMHRWHAEFEKQAPEEHEEFLRFLRIPDEEIAKIRDLSRQAAR